MLRCTICVLLLLPKSLLGFILLSSQGSLPPLGNDTFSVDVEDTTDELPFHMPFSNLERMNFPLEWDDITLSKDALRLKKKFSKRQKRDGSSIYHKIKTINTDKPQSFADPGVLHVSDQMSNDRYKRHRKDVYVIRNIHNIFLNRQQSLDNPSIINSKADITKYNLEDALTDTSFTSEKSTGQHHHHDSLSTSHSSHSGFSWKALAGIDTQRLIHKQLQEDHKFGVKMRYIGTYTRFRYSRLSAYTFKPEEHSSISRNFTSPFFVRDKTSDAASETATSRHKRHTHKVTRIKLSELIGMNSGIGFPIIIRKRSRIDAKVGVLVVVENSIYRQYMQDNANNAKAALARIRRYYGMIFSMMDQRFKTINDPYLSVSVKISGILVAESREDSSWLERIVDWSTARSHGRGSVLTDRALKKFTKWISSQSNLPEFDHAMVFTAYRLTNKQGVSLGGMAYLNAICDTQSGNAVSIVADNGDFQCVKVATHELAHSLGAYHDGDRQSKTCRADSNYVMSPLTSHQNHVLRNAFFFSPCSIRDMSYHLSKESSSCVRNEPAVYYSYDLQHLPPGQLYSADMQCKLIFGKKSEYCREGNLVDIMCGQLWCRDPNKDNGCRTNTYLTALPGTECGPNRVCHLGECIIDSSKNTIHRTPVISSINVITKPKEATFQMKESKKDPRELKQNAGNHVKRKRKNRCMEDKNPTYCEGLIKLNPGGCERRAIRQYCCFTCRQQQRQRPRRIKYN